MFGKPKKLKRIGSDIVSYVLIEAQAVKDSNDKQMIVHYAHAKIELIDFYIAVLDTGDKKYVVPHSKEYLVGIKNQLLAAIQDVIKMPVRNSGDMIKVEYPNDWQG
jgi:hypothetical protein